jgi:integrase
MLRYRTKSGRLRRPKIGRYPDMGLAAARATAKQILAMVALGDDPQGDWARRRSIPLMRDALVCWRDTVTKKLKSAQSYETIINHHLIPKLGKFKVDEVVQADVRAMHVAISKRAPTQANRVVATLSSFYRWASDLPDKDKTWQFTGDNPCARVKLNTERKRYRYMTPEEGQRIGQELHNLPKLERGALLLLMLTGARRGEIAGDKLDIRDGLLYVADHKTGVDKWIRLGAPAMKMIEDYKLAGKPMPTAATLSRRWKLVCARAGVENLKLHDMRHTFASVGISGGMPLEIMRDLLGHRDVRTTARYAHLVTGPAQLAADEVSRRVLESLTAEPETVTATD